MYRGQLNAFVRFPGEHSLSLFDRAIREWPIALQVFGGLAVCFAVGAIAGFAWGLLTLGVEAIACGTLAEK